MASSKFLTSSTLSPSQLMGYANSPISYLLKQYVLGSGREGRLTSRLDKQIPGTLENVAGKHVHTALEMGFGAFTKAAQKDIPGGQGIVNAIEKGVGAAADSLRLAGVPVSEHIDFMTNSIRSAGDVWHGRVAKHVAQGMSVESVLQRVRIEVEQNVFGPVGKGPGAKVVKGRLDTAIVDELDRTADIIDTKVLADARNLSKMEKYALQGKSYMYGMLSTNPDVDNVRFWFSASVPDQDIGIRGTQIVAGGSMNRADMPRVQSELMEVIAEMESMKMITAERYRAGGLDGVKEFIKDEFPAVFKGLPGKWRADAVALLPDELRFNWTTQSFIDEVVDKDGITGERFFASKAKRLREEITPESASQAEQSFTSYADSQISDAVDRLRNDMQKRGYTPVEIEARIAQETNLLRQSYNTVKTWKRGGFTDSLMRGAFSAQSQTPFSLIDRQLPGSWLEGNTRLRLSLTEASRARIKEISTALDHPWEAVEREVMDRTFKNKDFVQDLHHTVIANMRSEMEVRGMSTDSRRNARKMLRRPDLWVNKHMATMIDEEISRQTVGLIMEQDLTAVERAYGKIHPGAMKDLSKREAIETVKTGLVDMKVLRRNPELFVEQLARNDSFQGLGKSFSLSKFKFPVGMAAVAGMLAYMAGTNSVSSMLARKMEKAGEYLMGQQDEVETGEHASAYTSVRRLVYSDFGSPTRAFSPASSFFSKASVIGRRFFNGLSDSVSRYEAMVRAGEATAENVGKPGAAGIMRKLGDTPMGPLGLFVGSAAGMFILSGFLTNVKTDKEQYDEIEQRKRRLKRLRKQYWNKDSSEIEPESDLRRAYKAHTPFGSAVAIGAIPSLISSVASMFTNYPGIGSFVEASVYGAWRNIARPALESEQRTLLKLASKIKGSFVNSSRPLNEQIDEIVVSARQKMETAIADTRGMASAQKGKDLARGALHEGETALASRQTVGRTADAITDVAIASTQIGGARSPEHYVPPKDDRRREIHASGVERKRRRQERYPSSRTRDDNSTSRAGSVTENHIAGKVNDPNFEDIRSTVADYTTMTVGVAGTSRGTPPLMRWNHKQKGYAPTETVGRPKQVVRNALPGRSPLREYVSFEPQVDRRSLPNSVIHHVVNGWRKNKWGAEQNVTRLYAFGDPTRG